MKYFLSLLTLALVALTAPAGTLTTRDGKTFAGPLTFSADRITVTTATGPQSFPLADVRHADFKAGGGNPPKPGHGLRGDYFVGRSLGRLLLTRTDPVIDYVWADTLPHPALVPWGREFSVRWTGRLRPDRSETYRLISNTDDGVRVYLDDKLLIDRWHDQSAADATAEVALEKGREYDLRVEYYNGQSAAQAALSWASPSTPRQVIPADNLYLPREATSVPATTQSVALETPSTDGGPPFRRVLAPDRAGLKGEYFASRELEHLSFVRFDPNVDVHFHRDNPPDPAASPEGSIRWTGMLTPRFSEEYRFHAEVNRRIRLWVDEKLVIDQWRGEGGEHVSERIKLTAGRKVPFKVEYSSRNDTMLCRVRWSCKSHGRDTIPPDAFSVAPDEPLGRPVIGLVDPSADAFVAAPAAIGLTAAAVTPNGQVRKVAFFDQNTRLADLDAPPYRFAWKDPAPGVYRLRAKLTDTAGVAALSDTVTVTVTGKGDGSVKAPWGDFHVANNDFKTAGVAAQTGDGAFKIDRASGTLVSESENDAGHLVIQPLLGDGQIVARVTSVLPGPDDGISGAMAGVTIRENLKNRCRHVTLLYGQPAEEPVVSLVRRQDHWMNPVVSDRTSKTPQGEWFKLARHGSRVYAYTSADGKEWDLLATERFEAGAQAFVGLVAFGREKPATATFDNVRLIAGAPPLESTAKGILTTAGTFLAADVHEVDGNFVRYSRNGDPGKVAQNDVARILYKPLLADHAQKLSGRAGVLTTTGDFLDGDVGALKDGAVAISSVLFGLRKVSLNDETTAVVLRDATPARTSFTLTTTDGSTYRPKTIAPDAQGLTVDDASLGKVSLPLGAIAHLRAVE
jgi:hypothetical protein